MLMLILNLSNLKTITQRGVSGIDGLLSTAAGVAYTSQKASGVFIGDQSFLYDTNGLEFIRMSKVPIVVVVLNNNGGKIFKSLPIGEEAICDPLFVRPHSINIESLANAYGIAYKQMKNVKDFETFCESFEMSVSLIVECLIS